jgi:hypothetical protein
MIRVHNNPKEAPNHSLPTKRGAEIIMADKETVMILHRETAREETTPEELEILAAYRKSSPDRRQIVRDLLRVRSHEEEADASRCRMKLLKG